MKLLQKIFTSLNNSRRLALLPLLLLILVIQPNSSQPTVVTGSFDRNPAILENHHPSTDFLGDFVNSVTGTNSIDIAGVYVDPEFAFKVVRQPVGNPGYVSVKPEVVTEFALAEKSGSLGLLAHNNLAGKNFSRLAANQKIYLIHGDKLIDLYQVDTIEHFQALTPSSPYSNFIDADHPGKQMTSTELFEHIYSHAGALILQTCIANKGNPSWGRLFITAHRVSDGSGLSLISEKSFSSNHHSERFQ